jgi:hypothetical protein
MDGWMDGMKEHGWGSKQIDKGERQKERSSREG